MTEYKVKAEGSYTFHLSKDESQVGKLVYEKWFSFKAILTLSDNRVYRFDPKGFWGTTIELKQEDKILLNFKMNWNGSIIIHTIFDGVEKDYIFKQQGLLKAIYVLMDNAGGELLALQPDYKWNKLSTDYTITTSGYFDNLGHQELLLLTTIHCINYYMSMMMAATMT